ncbi:hypothetical protein VNO77_06801 [Canavalia gladiata]|uniref:Transmembrane protein n=1 Tax=Canavalia gladiata TaxID=3824 RepID=A0AAN9M707_CANGL
MKNFESEPFDLQAIAFLHFLGKYFFLPSHQFLVSSSKVTNLTFPHSIILQENIGDWGPVFVSVVLFILLTPGLLIQIPGKSKMVEFGNFQTSGVSILVHSIIYFALVCIFLMAVGIHMYTGS